MMDAMKTIKPLVLVALGAVWLATCGFCSPLRTDTFGRARAEDVTKYVACVGEEQAEQTARIHQLEGNVTSLWNAVTNLQADIELLRWKQGPR
jgi:hypothetical protein